MWAKTAGRTRTGSTRVRRRRRPQSADGTRSHVKMTDAENAIRTTEVVRGERDCAWLPRSAARCPRRCWPRRRRARVDADKDVGVEEICRAGGERMRDPCDVPHRESSVARVLRSSEVAHAGRQRPRHQHAYRQRGGDEHDRVTAARGQRSSSRLRVPSIVVQLSSSVFVARFGFACPLFLVSCRSLWVSWWLSFGFFVE